MFSTMTSDHISEKLTEDIVATRCSTMTLDGINSAFTYVIWHEEHLCNVSVLGRVHLSDIVMCSEGSLPCSWHLDTGSCLEPQDCSPPPKSYSRFSNCPVVLSNPSYCKWSLPFSLSGSVFMIVSCVLHALPIPYSLKCYLLCLLLVCESLSVASQIAQYSVTSLRKPTSVLTDKRLRTAKTDNGLIFLSFISESKTKECVITYPLYRAWQTRLI